MKKKALPTMLLALCLALPASPLLAQMGPGGYAGATGGWYCPWRSGTQGGWNCPWMGGGSRYGARGQAGPPPGIRQGQPITRNQARTLLQNYALGGNPNLKIGEITDEGAYFEGNIVNESDETVGRVQVNKETGWFRTIP